MPLQVARLGVEVKIDVVEARVLLVGGRETIGRFHDMEFFRGGVVCLDGFLGSVDKDADDLLVGFLDAVFAAVLVD